MSGWYSTINKKHLTPDELVKAARSKFLSAKAIVDHVGFEHEGEFYEGNEDAVYLAGYALELMLKRCIALKLDWEEYPPKYFKHFDGNDGDGYKEENDDKSFIVHDLNRLIVLAGLKKAIYDDGELKSHWDTAIKWQAGMRYCTPGQMDKATAEEILESILHMIRWIIANEENG